jgi:hypothetical protein
VDRAVGTIEPCTFYVAPTLEIGEQGEDGGTEACLPTEVAGRAEVMRAHPEDHQEPPHARAPRTAAPRPDEPYDHGSRP